MGKRCRASKRSARSATEEAAAPQAGADPVVDTSEHEAGSGAQRRRRRRMTEDAGMLVEDEDDGMTSLLRLRALLTPAGFGYSAAEEAAASAAKTSGKEASALVGTADERPDWTSRYYVVDASERPVPLEATYCQFHTAMDRSLRKAGFRTLFPIQAAVIPLLMRSAETAYDLDSPYNCDVCVAAPTGQGKTLAYAAPLVQAMLSRMMARPRALIVLPTRDLAMQVFKVFEMLRKGLGSGSAVIRAMCLIGQRNFSEEKRQLRDRPPDIVVCTPGRLADHYCGRDGSLDLDALRWFVADEADRLLSPNYSRWLDILESVAGANHESALQGAPAKLRVQKVLLSATMTWDPRKLAMLKLRRPMYFFSSLTGKYSTPVELKQYHLNCKADAKPLALLYLLGCMLRGEFGDHRGVAGSRAVVFCDSVDTAHRLARLLQVCCLIPALTAVESGAEGKEPPMAAGDGFEALRDQWAISEFSSNLTQRQRTALLAKFREAVVKCLVCSDVVARGIDVPDVHAVFNYTAPTRLQTYIHRVGRTARAGRSGHTFTFVPGHDRQRFEEMLRESADCWERISKYSLAKEAQDTKVPWYPRALQLLELCLKLEASGQIAHNMPLTAGDLQMTPIPAHLRATDGHKVQQDGHRRKDAVSAHNVETSAGESPNEESASDHFDADVDDEAFAGSPADAHDPYDDDMYDTCAHSGTEVHLGCRGPKQRVVLSSKPSPSAAASSKNSSDKICKASERTMLGFVLSLGASG